MRNAILAVLIIPSLAAAQTVVWQTNPGNLHDYALVQNELTWLQAQQFAAANGGHLAVIRSPQENAWLVANVLPPNSSAWIGAQRVAGQWQWVTREPFAYENWDAANGQPTLQPAEIHARIWTVTNAPGTWDDTQSAATHWFVLERSAELDRVGTGCAGSNGVPDLDSASLPILGTTMTFSFANLPLAAGPMIAFAGLVQEVTSLAVLGMPGCDAQLVPWDSTGLFQPGGATTWPVSVPANAGLLGLSVYLQAAVYDRGVNPMGGTVTNAVAARLGH